MHLFCFCFVFLIFFSFHCIIMYFCFLIDFFFFCFFVYWCFYFFFFSSRRRHTRCLSDWSSDVCSSDLNATDRGRVERTVNRQPLPMSRQLAIELRERQAGMRSRGHVAVAMHQQRVEQIGRASCRERV